MILEYVTQCAYGVVETAAPGDTERFGHRNLHARDVIAIPNWFEPAITEAKKHEIAHRILREKMIDAKDCALGKRFAQRRVERLRRREIVAERFLDGDPRVCDGAR